MVRGIHFAPLIESSVALNGESLLEPEDSSSLGPASLLLCFVFLLLDLVVAEKATLGGRRRCLWPFAYDEHSMNWYWILTLC